MEKSKEGLVQHLKNFFRADKPKEFGIEQYLEIEKKGKAHCPEEGCLGEVKYVRTRFDPSFSEGFHEETLFYRCTRNCRHHWKAIKNSSYDKPIFVKY